MLFLFYSIVFGKILIFHVFGIDESLMNSQVSACESFYDYACGGWEKKTQIPNDLPAWDRSFLWMRDQNQKLLREILEKKHPDVLNHPAAEKMIHFYKLCMDESTIESQGLKDLKPLLNRIDALFQKKSLKDKNFSQHWATFLAELHEWGVDAFFSMQEQQDFHDASHVIGFLDQAGLSLPDRAYYLKNDPQMLEVKKKYQKYIRTVFRFLGIADWQKQFSWIWDLESRLAQVSLSRIERRDPKNLDHRWQASDLQQKMPHFDWKTYWKRRGVENIQVINVTVPEFFKGIDQIFNHEELKKKSLQIQTYLKWQLIQAAIPALPQSYVKAHFQFVSQALTGQKKMESRWKRCVQSVDHQLGFALSRSFVQMNSGETGKKLASEMIHWIEEAFSEKLKNLSWMDSHTKSSALEKLKKIQNKIGYPDHWLEYDSLVIDTPSYLKALWSTRAWNHRYYLQKIGHPVDRRDWHMTPPTVNAYYDPSLNEMVFPAGILKPPFFNPQDIQYSFLPENYGGIGLVMGHELTHGFDDEGRKYDAHGNLTDWWSPQVARIFEKQTDCIVDQYNQYQSLPGVFIQGKLTLGENIADHGGLRIAYSAWKKHQASMGSVQKKSSHFSDKFSEDQRFFLSFAQTWCVRRQDSYARMLAQTDPHAPPRFRVNGTVSQWDQFARAFGCAPGTPMSPQKRCEVW